MNNEHLLRQKARETMEAGMLPSRKPDRTWGGPGLGFGCTVCDEPIDRQDMEFELEFTGEARVRHHLHVACHAAWLSELEKLEHARAAARSSRPTRAWRPAALSGGRSESDLPRS